MQIFEKEVESTPPEDIQRPLPSEEGIRSVLRSCEEQTSNFDWSLTVLAVAHQLSIPATELLKPLPGVILRALVYMLPLTQSLSENRLIHIEIGERDFICPLIVWAHHICSLNVTVEILSGANKVHTTFGTEPSQMVISVCSDVRLLFEPRVTLFETSSNHEKDAIITLSSDPDEFKIEALQRRPARAYGKAVALCLTAEISVGRDALLEEIMLMTASIAFSVAKWLRAQPHASMPGTDEDEERHQMMWENAGYEALDDSPGEVLYTGPRSVWVRPDDGDEPVDMECSESSGETVAAWDDDRQESSKQYKRTSTTGIQKKSLIPEQKILSTVRFIFDVNLEMASIKDYADAHEGQGLVPPQRQPSRRIKTILTGHAGFDSSMLRVKWTEMLKAARHLAIVVLALTSVEDLGSCAKLPLSCDLDVLATHAVAQHMLIWNGHSPITISELTWYNAIIMLFFGRDPKFDNASALSDHGWTVYLNTFDQPSEIYGRRMRDPATISPGCFMVSRGVPTRNSVVKHAIFDGPTYDGGAGLTWSVFERAGDTATLRCHEAYTLGRTYYGERPDSFAITLRLNLENPMAPEQMYVRRTGYRELYSSLWMTRWRTLIAIAHERQSDHRAPDVLLRTPDCCFQCAVDQTHAHADKWWLIL
ncbi:hypothetical protein DV737_g4422, partial [Chaetothyriales sp. CBS 132003]